MPCQSMYWCFGVGNYLQAYGHAVQWTHGFALLLQILIQMFGSLESLIEEHLRQAVGLVTSAEIRLSQQWRP
jgi:hypothetical protein